jgi:hypothetical protein
MKIFFLTFKHTFSSVTQRVVSTYSEKEKRILLKFSNVCIFAYYLNRLKIQVSHSFYSSYVQCPCAIERSLIWSKYPQSSKLEIHAVLLLDKSSIIIFFQKWQSFIKSLNIKATQLVVRIMHCLRRVKFLVQ